VSVEELFSGWGSEVVLEIDAMLSKDPAGVSERTVAWMVMRRESPAAMVFSESGEDQVALGVHPEPVQYLAPVSSAGRASVSWTPWASEGPPLVTAMV
jgi:hypothetical protein